MIPKPHAVSLVFYVSDIVRTEAFYRDVLGFAGFLLIQSFGMGDVGLDYMPHTLAFNVWSGPDAGLPPAGSAGLRWFTIVLPDAESLGALKGRLERAGAPLDVIGNDVETRDPFGNRIRLELAA